MRENVDVCVTTYNSGRTIDRCLRHLKKNLVQGDRVTVYDRFSLDETVDIVQKHGFEIVKTMDSLGKIRSEAINRSELNWIFYLDADIYIPDGFIDELFAWKDKLSDFGAVQGLPLNVFNERIKELELGLKYERYKYPQLMEYRGNTGNTLVSKAAASGFVNDWTVFEDYALLQYMKSKGFKWYLVDIKVPHDNQNYKGASLWGGAGNHLTKSKPLWKLAAGVIWMPMKAPWGGKWIQMKVQIYILWGYLRWKKYLIKSTS